MFLVESYHMQGPRGEGLLGTLRMGDPARVCWKESRRGDELQDKPLECWD